MKSSESTDNNVQIQAIFAVHHLDSNCCTACQGLEQQGRANQLAVVQAASNTSRCAVSDPWAATKTPFLPIAASVGVAFWSGKQLNDERLRLLRILLTVLT
jgi:hypothetical protein